MPADCAPGHDITPGNSTRRLRWLGLIVILLVAAALRFYGLFWGTGFGAHPHPDEEYLANRMFRVALQRPIQWANLLDARTSSLNPRRLNPKTGKYYTLEWGAFLLYVPRAAAAILDAAGWHALDTYEGYFLVGRVICAICSLLTVLLTFFLTSALYGESAGLFAAAALALAVTHIQLSHFMIVDVPLTMFAAATLLFSVRFAQRGGKWNALLMAAALGGAVSCKITGATLVLAPAAAYLLRSSDPAEGAPAGSWLTRLARVLWRYLPWSGMGFLLVFGTVEFYALLNPSAYITSLGPLLAMGSGENDPYFTRQFVNTTPYWFELSNLVRWGLGWPLGILSILAALWAILKPLATFLKARRWLPTLQTQGLLAAAAWAVPYFVYVGRLEPKYNRYMLPLVPVLCVLAGGLAVELGRYLRKRVRLPQWALPLAILAPTLCWALAYTGIYGRPHTWLQASRWLYTHIPAGAVVASPNWDQPLPVDIAAEGRSWQEHLGARVMLDFYPDMTPQAKFAHLMEGIRRADVLVLPTQREYNSVRRLPWRYPVEIRFFQLLFEEQLGYELARMEVSYPSLGPLTIVDDAAEESFSVYDHPKVLVYVKKNDLPAEELERLFAEALAATRVASRHGRLPPVELPVPGLDAERVRALSNLED